MREDDERRSRRDKRSSLGIPKAPKEIFKESQASKLGDAQGIPFFIYNYQVVSIETMFLFLYMICDVLGASLCFALIFFVIACWYLQSLYLALLVWRETRSRIL